MTQEMRTYKDVRYQNRCPSLTFVSQSIPGRVQNGVDVRPHDGVLRLPRKMTCI